MKIISIVEEKNVRIGQRERLHEVVMDGGFLCDINVEPSELVRCIEQFTMKVVSNWSGRTKFRYFLRMIHSFPL